MANSALKQKPARALKNLDDVLSEGENVAFNAPYFHRHLQQSCLLQQGYLFDYEDLKVSLHMERYIFNYLKVPSRVVYKYISKSLEDYLLAAVTPGAKYGEFTTPHFARPASRFMAMLLRHTDAQFLFDVTTAQGCEKFYTWLATQLVYDLDLPFSVVPDYVFDYLAAPHPSFAAQKDSAVALSIGMIEMWHNHFSDMPVSPDNIAGQRHYLTKLRATIAAGKYDPRFLPSPTTVENGVTAIPVHADVNRRNIQSYADRRGKSQHQKYETDVTLIDPGAQISGISLVTRQLANGLSKAKFKASLLRATEGGASNQDIDPAIPATPHSTSPINIVNFTTDRLVSHCLYAGLENLRDRYNIGYCFWDTNRLTSVYKTGMPLLDEIWAPSRFVYDTFKDNEAGIPVYLQPPSVTAPVIPPFMDRRYFGLRDDTFYFVFTGNNLSQLKNDLFYIRNNLFQAKDNMPQLMRQNPIGAVKAFAKAFPQQKDVALIIQLQYDKPDGDEEKRQELDFAEASVCKELKEALAGDERIHFITRKHSPAETAALINVTDCYVSLHHCEGFGFAILNAMLLGKPVIATNWSGNTDYITPETGCPVDFDLVKIHPAGFGYLNNEVGHVWADPSVTHAAEWMQKIYQDKAFAKNIGLKGQKFVCDRYNPEKCAANFEKRIRDVRAEIGIT